MSAALLFAAAVLATKSLTVGPTGFYQFCNEHRSECLATPGQTVAPIDLLQSINGRINRRISPLPEGSADLWSLNPSAGDCEDYAITKRWEVIRGGISSSAARIAIGTLGNGERHAVVVVTTATGEVVLDNLTAEIRPVDRAGIRFESIQSPENPRIWMKVRD